MTGVDTNVLVRLLTGDEPAQAEKARSVYKNPALLVTDTVLLESEWVLRHAYGFSPSEIHGAFTKLCGLSNVALSNPRLMMTALQWFAEGMDFADALHLASSQACRVFYTFDQKLARKAEGRGICKVKAP